MQQLYSAGATRVDVVVTRIDPRKVRDDCADTIEVTFPKEKVARVLDIVRWLDPDNWKMDPDKRELTDPHYIESRYAQSAREILQDSEPYPTVELWWD